MEDVFNDRQEKHRLLHEAGYRVISKWECDWKKDRVNEPAIQRFLKTRHVPQPLDPRDAFFGGRTNAYRLYYKVQGGTITLPLCQQVLAVSRGPPGDHLPASPSRRLGTEVLWPDTVYGSTTH